MNYMSRANATEDPDDLAYECRSVNFHEITDASSLEFEAAMRIYVESFPENERRPIATIKKMLESGESRLMVGEREKVIIFMALLYPIKGTSFLLGDYLATAESCRSTGIGRAFLMHILDGMRDLQCNFFLIEIENPYLNEDETKMRRLKFYKRLGMKELMSVGYILPPFQGTEPVELILMLFSREDADHLAGEIVRDLVIRLFGELYGRFEGDEFLTLTLKSIPYSVPLN
jgi:GNAT superfamily N-acetyltransferase